MPLGIDEAMIVVGAPGYLAARGIPQAPADLFGHDVHPRPAAEQRAVLRWEFERQGEEIRIDPPGRLTIGSPELSQQAALAGAGLAFVSGRHDGCAEIGASRAAAGAGGSTDPALPGLSLVLPAPARLPSAGLRAFIDPFPEARRGRCASQAGGQDVEWTRPAIRSSARSPPAFMCGATECAFSASGLSTSRLTTKVSSPKRSGLPSASTRRAVFDAALLGMDLGDDLANSSRRAARLPRLGGDQGDDMDHVETPLFCPILSP